VNSRSSRNAYASEDALLDALWRTLIGGRTEPKDSGSNPPDNRTWIFEILCGLILNIPTIIVNSKQYMSQCRDRLSAENFPLIFLNTDNIADLTIQSLSEADMHEISALILNNLMHRSFMSTTADRAGLAHWTAEQGEDMRVTWMQRSFDS